MIILNIILILISIIILFLAILLIIPIKYSISLDIFDKLTYRLQFSLFSGLVKGELSKTESKEILNRFSIFGIKTKFDKEKTKKPDKEKKFKKKKKKKKTLFSKIQSIKSYTNKKLIISIYENLKKMLKHFMPNEQKINCKIGLDEPYIMGLIAAAYYPNENIFKKNNIHLDPIFTEEIINLELYLKGYIRLIFIAFLAFKIFISLPNKLEMIKNNI
jgi:hypothetical protein